MKVRIKWDDGVENDGERDSEQSMFDALHDAITEIEMAAQEHPEVEAIEVEIRKE